MGEKADFKIFLENVPLYNSSYKIIVIYFYHMLIFSASLFLFWLVTSYISIGALIMEFILSCGANIPFIYMFNNAEKIRNKYLKKNKKYPWQSFFLKYSYTSPLGCAAFYTPLLLKQDLFLINPLISLPQNIFSKNIFPEYIAIPIGIILLIIGFQIATHSKGFDGDMHSYLHVIKPDKKRIKMGGVYKYVRHPRFLCRLISAFGISIIANNLLAMFVVIVHFIPYLLWMNALDKEYRRMYGKDIVTMHGQVPSLIPKIRCWKKFLKTIFS